MPYVCWECGTKLEGTGSGHCGACGVEFAKNPPRNATSDPDVVDEFVAVRVGIVNGVTKRRLSHADGYVLDVTREAFILIRTGEFLWYRSTIRDLKSTTIDIYGGAVASYYLNKPFMGSDMKDVTPKDAAGNPLSAMQAFRTDPKHNRVILATRVSSVGLRKLVSKKLGRSINARIYFSEDSSVAEAYSLNIPSFDQYTYPRLGRLVSGLNVEILSDGTP